MVIKMVVRIKIGDIFCQPADEWVRYYQVVKINATTLSMAEIATKFRTVKGTTWVSPVPNAILDYPINVKFSYDGTRRGIDLPRGGYGYRMTATETKKGVELYR